MSESLGARIQGEKYRITVLTPRVVRLEWSASGRFEDRPTTFASFRDLPTPEYELESNDRGLTVTTDYLELEYDRGPFSVHGLSLKVRGDISNYHSVWRYGQDLALPAHRTLRRAGRPLVALDGNLGGATRTLDRADGAVELDPGVNSTYGFAVIDDTDSMVFDETGHLAPRDAEPGYKDLYLFSAGHDHVGALKDFFAISGAQPLLPRWALGNWWSRYHRYTQRSYLELMDRFTDEGVPLSVAVIDMDWHLTDIDPAYGSDWTGYTWNRELFPDPQEFQKSLHDRGLKVSLNVHPADGVRAFEEAYGPMCRALGRPEDGRAVQFDVTDRAFMSAYFDVLHRGLEELGTDFWWVDWQSGPYSKREGMDPLWVLNHGHYNDNARRNPHGITFSRYAGPGSHRYPVGFSGDAVISWDSLAFQPRMTAAGANIGYGWWSHDIGGHMEGIKDDELLTRWVQFGVFSPIMRLHSSNSRFSDKEPWKISQPEQSVYVDHMRLRHRMVPYLHAMNLRAHRDGRSLVEPVYFEDQSPLAYQYRDEYLFGSELLVAPIIRPADHTIRRGSADVWLPAGRWTDILTGHSYTGARAIRMYRDISSIPVLLRAGGFLPLVAAGEDLDVNNLRPNLEVLVGAGANGSFGLEEENADGTWAETRFTLDTQAGRISIEMPHDHDARRQNWTFTLLGFGSSFAGAAGSRRAGSEAVEPQDTSQLAEQFAVTSGALQGVESLPGNRITLAVSVNPGAASFEILSPLLTTEGNGDPLPAVESLLSASKVGHRLKEMIYNDVARRGSSALASVPAMGRTPGIYSAEVRKYDHASPELLEALVELLDSADHATP